jgi:hypothetical protein
MFKNIFFCFKTKHIYQHQNKTYLSTLKGYNLREAPWYGGRSIGLVLKGAQVRIQLTINFLLPRPVNGGRVDRRRSMGVPVCHSPLKIHCNITRHCDNKRPPDATHIKNKD